jgi:hypothetical protein
MNYAQLRAVLVLLFCSPGMRANAAPVERPVLAVLPLTFVNMARADVRSHIEIVRGIFEASGRFKVLSTDQVRERLQRFGVKSERCAEVECAVEFGAVLKAHRVFAAYAIQLGRRILIRARYVDVVDARARLAESVELVGDPLLLRTALSALATRALGRPLKEPTRNDPVVHSFDGPKEPFYRKPWFLITVGTLVAGGTAAALVLGLRSSGPNPGGATVTFLSAP